MKNYLSTSNDINNSRPLDVHVWSDYPEFNQLINKLWVKYFPSEDEDGSSRTRTSRLYIRRFTSKRLLLDLVCVLDD